MSRELAVATHMQVSSIYKLNSMSHYQRVMSTKRKKSSKMSLYMTWIWPMLDPREVMTS